VLLNGCECEPILTADHRVLLEFADDVVYGLKAIMKASGAERGVIAIEDNKPDAVELLREKTAGLPNIEVVVAKTKYPQGAEKMLIKKIMGREVPPGGLPMDVGAIVSNVSTAKAISDAIKKGLPLIERVVCVSGERIVRPGNYIVKNGTSVKEIISYCGGLKGGDVTVKLGGPMMGFKVSDLNVPVIKSTNGIIAIETVEKEAAECIKCGRCMDVCPMELRPLYYAKYALEENWEGMKAQNVMNCIECGCCEYICSSKIPLVERIKIGKTAIRKANKMLITQLKSQDTVKSLARDKTVIVNCHGCKEVYFPEHEADKLQRELAGGAEIAQIVTADYICNPENLKLQLKKYWDKFAEADTVLVFSCGVGVQNRSRSFRRQKGLFLLRHLPAARFSGRDSADSQLRPVRRLLSELYWRHLPHYRLLQKLGQRPVRRL
jgi:Na+-translocating ferredoxin:NAD+ oxidoreductase RnfC subunit